MTAIIDYVSTGSEGMNVQVRMRVYDAAISLIAEQGPMRPLEQLEQPRCLACRSADRCVGRTVARANAGTSRRLLRDRENLSAGAGR